MKTGTISTLLFAVLASSAQAGDSLICFGTEPFWDLEVSDLAIRYDSPDETTGSLDVIFRKSAENTGEGLATVTKTKSTTLTTIRAEGCTDGMSERTYTHHAVYDNKGTILYGCCNEK